MHHDITPASVSWELIGDFQDGNYPEGNARYIIAIADVRRHLRLEDYGDAADENPYLMDLIAAAGDVIETHTRRPIRDQRRRIVIARESTESHWNFDGWWWGNDGEIVLNTTPIRSVDAISYMDGGETRTVADTGRRVTGTGQGIERNVKIYPPYGESWPWWSTSWDNDTEIRIEITCGYGFREGPGGTSVYNIPPAIRHAARLLIHDWYSLRGQTLVGTISAKVGRSLDYLLSQYTREVFG